MSASSAPTRILARAEGSVLLLQKSRLTVLRGPDRGRQMVVERARVAVGSEEGCDLVLADASVSRRQFEIRTTPDGYLLRDLGSTNGTTVDGLRVVEAFLRKSARIGCGQTEIKFAPLAESVELELSPRESFGDALGRSAAIRHVFAVCERVAAMDATVMVEGETGTGKELIAEGIHRASRRAEGPFVVVDCGSIPENLIESELFGHERGAFTGAVEARAGAFEEADGGTLFLDEVGEMPLELQPKLLRALESREVRRLGSQKTLALDLRIVAASNRDLATAVRQGKFREDLFYRLAVVRVVLPPLRDRREDVRLLAREFARRVKPGVDPASWLDEATLAMLEAHEWPGNVRELRNVVERLAAFPGYGQEFLFEGRVPAVAASEASVGGAERAAAGAAASEASVAGAAGAAASEASVGVAAPGAPAGATSPSLPDQTYHEAKRRLLDAFERRYLIALLEAEGGVVSRAADRAAVPRQTFHRLIKKHGLRGE